MWRSAERRLLSLHFPSCQVAGRLQSSRDGELQCSAEADDDLLGVRLVIVARLMQGKQKGEQQSQRLMADFKVKVWREQAAFDYSDLCCITGMKLDDEDCAAEKQEKG
ncbi:hypothetical protein GW17_00044144 [Ensete ventricosum]|uniref:Uncharacterized protein n=1 Tax=Ensete ventricosum TaxID=4639 RepID=A0A426YDY3_ENSVE|nr:hypothetical protein B296_00010820 [Ensete ventricosum]RWV93399.1 hypothetical protein GW17_00044144 [Ensete ventricosum]